MEPIRNAQDRDRRRPVVTVEALERRELMAAQVWEDAGTLWVIGDNRANQVEIYDFDGPSLDGDVSFIRVVADGHGHDVGSTITSIRVDLKGGNDRLFYELGDPASFQQVMPTRDLYAAMGGGNDQVYLLVSGFAFEADPSAQALGPGSWTLRFELGNGNDTFVQDQNADLLGLLRAEEAIDSVLDVGVFGGGGNDWLEYNTVRPLRAELAQLDLVLRGGNGNDTLTLRNEGAIEAEESSIRVDRYGENGNDRILGALDVVLAGQSTLEDLIDTGSGSDRVSTLLTSRSRRPRLG
jgi:hypothetical protein